jgi:putative flippase GtrA
MLPIDRLKANFPRAAALVEPHFDVLRKAISFALIGVINVAVDTSVFLLTYSYLRSPAWVVGVPGSYPMNSFITFAAESGRRLRWRDYGTFVASGILGVIASTTVLVVAAQFMPVLPAKGCAILASFAFNFSMSHFVVFRPRGKAAARTR